MPIEQVYVVGAGGHAKVVLDALMLATMPQAAFLVVDDDARRHGRAVAGHVVAPRPQPAAMAGARFHLAIGVGSVRQAMHRELITAGAIPMTVRHPAAVVAASALIGEGSFLAARCVVAPDARIGGSTIVNHGAIVDHDCIVGEFAHIAPNATLSGGVSIGDAVLIGAGATILPGVRIGDGAVIAAGATIVRDVAAGETVIFALVRKESRVLS